MIKIGVVGLTGRMSKVIIEEINNHQDCELSGVLVRSKSIDSDIAQHEDIVELAKISDAVIDFSNPTTSLQLAKKLVNSKIPLICGTTGFTKDEFKQLENAAKNLPIIWSANMSIGVNLLQMLLKLVSSKLGSDFDPAIIDIHHRHKKDSPSGTALMLAKTIEEANSTHKVQISSLRIGEVPGDHQIIFSGDNESITLSHQAYNRNIFANGAIKACLWAQNKPNGLYSMQDVLN